MKKSRIQIFLIILVAVGVLVAAFSLYRVKSGGFSGKFSQYGMSVQGAENFALVENGKDYFVGKNDDAIMRVRVTGGYKKEDADRYRSEQMALLEGVFTPQLPPYPEFLTQKNACADVFLPERKEARYGTFYTLFANDRLGYGVCAEDLVAHRAGIGFFYCPNAGMVVKLELFGDSEMPKKEIDDLMNSFSCGNAR